MFALESPNAWVVQEEIGVSGIYDIFVTILSTSPSEGK